MQKGQVCRRCTGGGKDKCRKVKCGRCVGGAQEVHRKCAGGAREVVGISAERSNA